MRIWAKVISIKETTALAKTSDEKLAIVPTRHQLMADLQLGDIVSFTPETPRNGGVDPQGKGLNIEFFARDPFIEAVSLRAHKMLVEKSIRAAGRAEVLGVTSAG
jgi:hypothetical protein